MNPRVLFVLKRREDYSQDPSYSYSGVSTGLLNSATFMKDMLEEAGIDTKLVVVIDNNGIDREVNLYKPTHVIIEALWVVPEKFEVLSKLHPTVKWIIRFHSEAPFIASEGIAFRWLHGYLKQKNVLIGVNAPRLMEEIRIVMHAAGYSHAELEQRVHYMPNFYPVGDYVTPKAEKDSCFIDVGCFGAIRPLKNHVIQAIAAIKFADKLNKKLRFHINVGRVEMKGDPILHNLQGMFAGLASQGHELVTHQWMGHAEFLEVCKQMDIGMQVSFSETFNIVAADLINNGVPVVMSNEVPWAKIGLADPTESEEISSVMLRAWKFRCANVGYNRLGLKWYTAKTRKIWLKLFLQTI